MTKKTSSPVELEGVRPKELAIVGAATQLLVVHGYAGMSMDMVSAEAHVSKRTLYSYFSSKEELFGTVIQRHCAQLWQPLNVAREDDGSIRAQLVDFAERFLEVGFSPIPLALYRVVIGEAVRFPELAEVFYASGPAFAMERLEGLLREAQFAGHLRIKNMSVAVEQFFSLLMGPAHIRALLGLSGRITQKKRIALALRNVETFLSVYGV